MMVPIMLVCTGSFAQVNENASILKLILAKYYQNEKVIKPGRLQLLSFYCNQAPNNEEVIEVINGNAMLKQNAAEIRKQIVPTAKDWSAEYNTLFASENQYLKSKVNECMSLEEFQEYAKKLNLNNQRLLIIGVPIYFAKTNALVKVTFYRNIEHNSGYYFLMNKENGLWVIKETLNAWST